MRLLFLLPLASLVLGAIPPLVEDDLHSYNNSFDYLELPVYVVGEENYITSRNKKTHPVKMEISKYCPKCRKMTLHKERK